MDMVSAGWHNPRAVALLACPGWVSCTASYSGSHGGIHIFVQQLNPFILWP